MSVDPSLSRSLSRRNAPGVNTGAHPVLLVCHRSILGARAALSIERNRYLAQGYMLVTYLWYARSENYDANNGLQCRIPNFVDPRTPDVKPTARVYSIPRILRCDHRPLLQVGGVHQHNGRIARPKENRHWRFSDAANKSQNLGSRCIDASLGIRKESCLSNRRKEEGVL